MTTDPFTDAADDAAEQSVRGFIGTDEAAYGYRSGFTDGAEWARTHLAAQEPTEEEVYAVRLVTHGALSPTAARAALSAARAARRDEEKR